MSCSTTNTITQSCANKYCHTIVECFIIRSHACFHVLIATQMRREIGLNHRHANEAREAPPQQFSVIELEGNTHTCTMCVDFLGSMLTSSKLESKLNKLGLGVHVSPSSCTIAHRQ